MNGLKRTATKLSRFKNVTNLIGLKAIYQFAYIIFNLAVIKKLSISEYGIYSYIVALIVYFSTIPLIGLPVYLQKTVARQEGINKKYLNLTLFLFIMALFIAYAIMPALATFQKIALLFIISFNCLIIYPISIQDGLGNYTFQYKLLFFSSFWMIICLCLFLINIPINLALILNCWFVNSMIVLIIASFLIFRLLSKIQLIIQNVPYKIIFIDLLLLYAVAIPDGFARFYDRYLGHTYLDNYFLGNYSFNLMIVLTVYALFVRPINSILVTELAKKNENLTDCINVIKKYYVFGFTIYFSFFISYIAFSDSLLSILGLNKYIGTNHYFIICFINALLYFLSLPFTTLIALTGTAKQKIIFCLTSLFLFNIPLFLLLISNTNISFFVGFVIAYFLNLILALVIERRRALYCFESFTMNFVNILKIGPLNKTNNHIPK